jgi:endonuclease III
VLSQATSDINSGRAYAGLRAKFDGWEEVADADPEEVADAIRAGGIAEVKAGRIHEILAEIERREGRLDLSILERMGDREATDYLCSLPGVGVKTAACVLLFSLGRDAFPVDTHVHRVAVRLGLVPEDYSAAKAHKLLATAVPAEIRYEFHLGLIRHGREVCRARHPRCSDCVLFDICEAGPRLLSSGVAV